MPAHGPVPKPPLAGRVAPAPPGGRAGSWSPRPIAKRCRDGAITQPVNTVYSLGFVVAGALVLAARRRKRARPPGTVPVGWAMVAAGLGSIASTARVRPSHAGCTTPPSSTWPAPSPSPTCWAAPSEPRPPGVGAVRRRGGGRRPPDDHRPGDHLGRARDGGRRLGRARPPPDHDAAQAVAAGLATLCWRSAGCDPDTAGGLPTAGAAPSPRCSRRPAGPPGQRPDRAPVVPSRFAAAGRTRAGHPPVGRRPVGAPR